MITIESKSYNMDTQDYRDFIRIRKLEEILHTRRIEIAKMM